MTTPSLQHCCTDVLVFAVCFGLWSLSLCVAVVIIIPLLSIWWWLLGVVVILAFLVVMLLMVVAMTIEEQMKFSPQKI